MTEDRLACEGNRSEAVAAHRGSKMVKAQAPEA
jgi:hypothetical protein